MREVPGEVLAHALIGMVRARRGDAVGAREQVRVIHENRRAFGHHHHLQYDAACIHALCGSTDEAITWLSQAARNGFPCHPFFEKDPLLASLRGHGRFERLIAELRGERAVYARLYEQLRNPHGAPASTHAAATAHPPSMPHERSHCLFAQGNAHLLNETLGEYVAAIDCFGRATEEDDRFALAWAGMADACARIAFNFQPEGKWYERAIAACDRALALDPDLPEARCVRGRLLWAPQRGFDHDGAMREFAAAIAGRPTLDDAEVQLGTVLHHVGLIDEALVHRYAPTTRARRSWSRSAGTIRRALRRRSSSPNPWLASRRRPGSTIRSRRASSGLDDSRTRPGRQS